MAGRPCKLPIQIVGSTMPEWGQNEGPGEEALQSPSRRIAAQAGGT